jgi:YYY domain-containing protein
MRYFLPIYPFLALFAAWGLLELWKVANKTTDDRRWTPVVRRLSSGVVIGFVLAGTLAWAWGFTSIYRAENTRVQASRWIYQNVPAPINVRVVTDTGDHSEPLPLPNGNQLSGGLDFPIAFTPRVTGTVNQISIGYARNLRSSAQPVTFQVVLANDLGGLQPLARAELHVNPSSEESRGGTAVSVLGPVPVLAGQTYYLILTVSEGGPATISGSTVANEEWDEGLPVRLDGRDAFGGLYQGWTNHVRWNDDENKRVMFMETLALADYLILPSQRGIWSTSRLPNTYPMTMEYYRALFDGRLGFDRVATFTSPIRLGPLQISDVGGTLAWNGTPQLPLFNDNPLAAEEAFSVYDHAPVWIFKKRPDFDLNRAMAVLDAVDLKQVVVQGPREATAAPTLLMLPPDRLAGQRAGGTWSEMFNPESPLNKYQPLGVVAWWLTCVLLGWAAFPIVFVALPGLPDRGYALTRNLALLLVAWLSWLFASFRILPFTGGVLWLMAGGMALVSGLIVWRRRQALAAWLKENGRYVLVVEALALFLFVAFLLIRLGNPDLWHPFKGGEKPMDFSYFNAVLKSTSFPPYDPWFSGGYLNYYYFGFVVVATVTKMLGIVPAFAYNLILPMLFSMAGMGAFCVAFNLVAGGQRLAAESLPSKGSLQRILANPYLAGIAAAFLFVVLGNLGEWNVVMNMFRDTARDVTPIVPFKFVTDWQRLFVGLWRVYVQHVPVRAAMDQWYWNATRVIPDSQTMPITEFPFFTFLYADLHAHMIVLTITVIALAWALSTVLSARGPRLGRIETLATWLTAGLVFGSIQPSNLSDYQTYWALGCVAIAYGELRKRNAIDGEFLKQTGWRCLLLIGLSMAFFWPYTRWRGEGYGSVNLWRGDKTPLDSYLTIHGLFLFVIFIFLIAETRRWMQRTLLQDVKDLLGPAVFAFFAFVLMVFGLWWLRYEVALVALPLIAWTGLLMIRKDAEPERRAALGLIGLGLLLTVMVEVVVAKGDIGRMNTVFKFYLQVWTLLSVAGGAALAWVWAQMPEWRMLNRGLVQFGVTMLVMVASLYTVLATSAKIQDRFPAYTAVVSEDPQRDCKVLPGQKIPYDRGLPARQQPHSLNGMDYMQWSAYCDKASFIPLKYDYEAIRWMQDNVRGSPVIVEVNATEYKWGSRFTINTGLPGVLGWNWHQRQQRVVLPDRVVWDRSNAVNGFYMTFNENDAMDFLEKYDVAYVVVGQYERAYFPSPSLAKFDSMVEKGMLSVAYRNDGTVIYEVVDTVAGN